MFEIYSNKMFCRNVWAAVFTIDHFARNVSRSIGLWCPEEVCGPMASKPELERLVSATERTVLEKKELVMNNIEEENKNLQAPDGEEIKGGGLQPTEALKQFFNHVSLFSAPGISNAEVVELSMTDTIGAAIEKLFIQKVMGAPVRDPHQTGSLPLTDQYVGLLDFASLVLWALERFEEAEAGLIHEPKLTTQSPESNFQREGPKESREDFFGLLDKLDHVKSTQVSTMASSFRWGPFFPVRPEDTLLHVLLILSKHRLKAVPVVDAESSKCVRAFITQNVALHLLLQCEGLPWFETIAGKEIRNAGFETEYNAEQLVFVHGDETLVTALHAMWKYRISGVPILDRPSKRLIGNIRYCDLLILLEDAQVFSKRNELLAQDFLKEHADDDGDHLQGTPLQEDFGAAISAAALSLANVKTPPMQDPVTFSSSDTMKEAMQKLFRARSDRGFIVDDVAS
ncbi:SNF1-related protein kinase regulatory subunit gamma-1 isoform X1 [Physcomitrium patens]|uniref:CBS domain-containing protein n=2 Tax=Physcomitrium patens TaxID=3218 RepID=A0A7I4D1C1_PHYPA|nr:SNF1-related protein kinase regulatory subunit gamma-1-like isoform X1 [Physcomitrium patens]|eukprot:XP_024366318.1 SNF1-related protein kinase regulatory subunit gamma-1-like isoform X1 [Physcomitrella patens]